MLTWAFIKFATFRVNLNYPFSSKKCFCLMSIQFTHLEFRGDPLVFHGIWDCSFCFAQIHTFSLAFRQECDSLFLTSPWVWKFQSPPQGILICIPASEHKIIHSHFLLFSCDLPVPGPRVQFHEFSPCIQLYYLLVCPPSKRASLWSFETLQQLFQSF